MANSYLCHNNCNNAAPPRRGEGIQRMTLTDKAHFLKIQFIP